MGFSKMIYLYCDGEAENCEIGGAEAFGGDGMFRSIVEYRAEMKIAGWHFKGNEAFCPSCWQSLKEHKK